MIGLDWAGLAAFVGALTGLIGALTVAYATLRLGRPLTEVHAAVSTPPGAPPLGQIASDSSETLGEVQTAVNGNTPPRGTPQITR